MIPRNLDCVVRHLRRLSGVATDDAPTDQQLLACFTSQGDAAAFTTLVERHAPLVWSVCRRSLPYTQDAEDVFQATFLVLLRRAGAVRWQASIAGWLYQVASRLAREVRTRTAQRRLLERQAAEARSRRDRHTAGRELAELLDEELQRLPEVYRTPLLLCYLEGLTGDQAARQLGWSLRTLQRRLGQGRELLRCRLLRNGITLSAALIAPALTRSAVVPSALIEGALQTAASFKAGFTPASANVLALADGFLRGR
jgi:RNA polymerase sigma factor (sigma-70 family)